MISKIRALLLYTCISAALISSCTLFYTSNGKTEGPTSKCAVPPSQSKLYKRIPMFAVSGGREHEDAAFVLEQLKVKINDDSVKVAKAPRFRYVDISFWDILDTLEQEKMVCYLREIFDQNDLYPINVTFYGWGEGMNEQTGEKEQRRVIVRELVVE